MQRLLLTLFVICAIVVVTACVAPVAAPAGGSESAGAAPAATGGTSVTAMKVDAVSLDAAAAYWADAPVLTVPTVGSSEGAPDGADVNIQAVYDDQTIALRFEWADPTESLMKAAWTWDGSKFTKSGDEDRIQLIFPIQNNAEFASKGCAFICHNLDADQKNWYMASESADLTYDVIHWKSTRTNPYDQSDDQFIGVSADPAAFTSGRVSDAKESGGYADNLNEAKDGPAFMHGSDPTAQFIMAGEEVPIDTSALAAGAVIPGFVLAPFVGSRGDQAANGVWQDGKWVVVLTRALDTGHEDDVVFTPPKPYAFGLSITEDGTENEHTNAPEVLTLEWQ